MIENRMEMILQSGHVAVVTGAAKGIGAAVARALAARGMKLALFDIDGSALDVFAATLQTEVLSVQGDVSDSTDLARFFAQTQQRFGIVHLLVNNAGIMTAAGPWDDPALWRRIIDVDFYSVLAMQHLFVPGMIAGDHPAAIVNLGSKEGITTPPGNAAYSVAKAGVKVLTEQLEHELRTVTAGRVSAHLLVPGYTWTPMNFPGVDPANDRKPNAPWTAEELTDYFLKRLENGDFYILCPDNDVSSDLDRKRIQWAADDMNQNRPALSRWHADWKDRFAVWVKS